MTRLVALFTAAAVLVFCMAQMVRAQEPLPSWVTITPAQDCSQGCWKIVDAYYLPQEESAGLHHLFGRTRNAEGAYIVAPFTLAWNDGQAVANTKTPPDWGDHALWSCFFPDQGEVGGYRAWAGTWEANSDTIEGMGLPYCHHVTYWVTWQWVEGSGAPTPTPAPTATPTPTPPPPLPYRLGLPLVSKH